MVDRIARDVRYAFRTLAHAPTFTAAAVATIALAVGSTTAIFAVVDNILLRPLPFPASERAIALCESNPASPAGWCGASPMNVADWARESAALERAGVARTESFIALSASGAYGGPGAIVTPGFFEVLGVRPMLGRLIEDGDLPRGSNRVVVVTEAFWQQRLGSDPSIVGRSIAFDQGPFTVIGVLPAGTWMPDPFADVQVWKPLTASIDNVENRSWRGFTAIGRLASGASQERLLSELAVIRERLAAEYPEANRDWGLRIVPLRDKIVGDISATLWIFLGMAVLVVLIASANVAGLLLVRAAGRAAEFALRASLGAGRGRVLQQLITESFVLSIAGGAAGVLLAVWATAAFVSVAPSNIPRLAEVSMDSRVAGFAFALAALIALLFGGVPARRAWHTDLNGALKGLRTSTERDSRMRAAFTAVQLALALTLLVGAALLTRSFARWTAWDPGFDRSNVVTTWMLPPNSRDIRATVATMERVRDEVASVPGVQSVALGSAGPIFGGTETGGIAIEGRPPIPIDRMPTVEWFDVDPHYFATLGIRLLKGRDFTPGDAAGATPVAVVNETLARRMFPGEDAIGRRVTVQSHPAEIVGVIADIVPLTPGEAAAPQIYWPIRQYPRGAAYLIMRNTPGVAGIREAVGARVAAVNPAIQLNPFTTLDERFARRLVSPRFNMLLVGFFALISLVLAAVGVYGVIAYGVAMRSRDFAVRMALGCTPSRLVGGVVRSGMRLAVVGVGAGIAGAIVMGRVLQSLLYGLPATDLASLSAAIALLVAIAFVAVWVPARRASRVDPADALRAQ